ncbi:MAG: PAS domain S-box protein [Methanotrichaceae archaeon]
MPTSSIAASSNIPEEKIAAIIKGTNDFVYVSDPEGHILYINEAGRKALGIGADADLTALRIATIHPAWANEIIGKEGIPSAIRDGTWSGETALLSLSGNEIPISHVITVCKSANGCPEYISMIGRDVTKLKEVELRLQKILNSTPIGIFLIDPTKHTILDANDSTIAMVGVPKETMIGQICHKFICPAEKGSCPVTDLHQTVDRSERVLLSASGERIPILKTVDKVILGGRECLLETFINIKERKQAEEALKASEAKYRQLHDSMMDAFISIDMRGRIKEYNEPFLNMLGYTPEEILELTDNDLTPDKWHVFQSEIITTQVLARGYSDIYEKEYRRKDGTIFPVELRTVLLKNDAGKPTGMWTIVRDITERKRSQEIIQQQARDILEISTPVVQLWEGVLALPLIGTLDSQRTQQITERLLNRIVETNSPFAIIDLTGVPTVDTQTGRHLIDTISAVRLLGTQTLLTGIRPEIAQTLVHLGIDMSGIVTRTTLASGLRYALDNINRKTVGTADKR